MALNRGANSREGRGTSFFLKKFLIKTKNQNVGGNFFFSISFNKIAKNIFIKI